MPKEPERWHLTQDGHEHTIEISSQVTTWVLRWSADGTEVASKKTSDTTVVLDGKKHGAVRLKLPTLTGPARQVTLYTAPAVAGSKKKPKDEGGGAAGQAHLGVGGTDFEPEAGSKAARREAWIREHPHQYAARRTATALAGVLVPIALIWLFRKITWRPDIDLPTISLPSIPWPEIDLPDLPWPDVDLPTINLPDLPDLPDLPGWVQYVWPVLLTFGIAQAELRRRRQQDEKRKAAAAEAAAREAELKAANEKKPVLSKLTQALPGRSKPEKTAVEEDEKSTQACRVPSTPPKHP